jgi:hypothetical protein
MKVEPNRLLGRHGLVEHGDRQHSRSQTAPELVEHGKPSVQWLTGRSNLKTTQFYATILTDVLMS